MPPAKASKRKASNGYRLPDPIPSGEIVLDGKKKWRIGKSIGVGGFGEIYLCSSESEHEVKDTAPTVMKVEPSENGPLFVEMHFYVRAATPASMEAYKKDQGHSKDIGIPCFRGKGLHSYKGQSYRFLVIDRYGKDLQKIFQTGKKTFSPKAAYNLALRCLDALEYIHAQGYVHNDLKAQNLLLGHGRSKENDVFLVDFGLVSKYKVNGVHLEYKPDARRAHDGTIEYTSRDAHIGAHSRRSDLEILGYNLVHWMSGNLPWMNNLTNPVYVHTQKKGFMSDIPSFMRNCFGEDSDYPDVLETFLHYTVGLEFDTKPDYDYCRSLFRDELRRLRLPADGKIDFSTSRSHSQQKKRSRRRQISFNDVELELSAPVRSLLIHPTPTASPPPLDTPDSMTSAIHSTRSTAPASSSSGDGEEWCWERVLCSDPEMLIRQASRNSEAEDDSPLARQRKAVEEQRQKESLVNPTPAMVAILQRIQEREIEREQLNWQQQLQHLTGKKKSKNENQWLNLTQNPLTPAMEEVINMRAKRVSIEVDIPITPEPSDDELDYDYDDEDFDIGEESDSSHEEYRPPTPKRKKKPSGNGVNTVRPIPSVSVQNLMPSHNRIRNKGKAKRRRKSILQNNTPTPMEPPKKAETPQTSTKSRKFKAPMRCSSRLRRGAPKSTSPSEEDLYDDDQFVKAAVNSKREGTPTEEVVQAKQMSSTIEAIKLKKTSSIPQQQTTPGVTSKPPSEQPKKKIIKAPIPPPKQKIPSLEDLSPQLKWEKALRVNPERLLKKKKYDR